MRKILLLIIFIILSSTFILWSYCNVWAWTENYTFDSLSSSPVDGGNDGFASIENYNGNITLSTEQAYGGSGKSAKFTITPSTQDNMSVAYVQLPSSLGEGNELWTRYYMFTPIGHTWNGNQSNINIKFYSIHISPGTTYARSYITNAASYKTGWNVGHSGWWLTSSGDNTIGCAPYFPIMGNYGCSVSWDCLSEKKLDSSLNGSWHSYETYFKLSQNSNTGRIRIWIDGDLQVDAPFVTLGTSGSLSENPFLFHTYNNGVADTKYWYIDELTMTNSQPSNQDEFGNYMIGTTASSTPTVSISAPDSQASE